MREQSDPAIAGIARDFGPRPAGKIISKSAADVHRLDPRFKRQAAQRGGRAHGILFFAQMADDADSKSIARSNRPAVLARISRLINDSSLCVMTLRQIGERHLLQRDDAGRHFERCLSFAILVNVTVKVRSGQHNEQGAFRMQSVECAYGIRAAPRMQRDQEIAIAAVIVLSDFYALAELPEYPYPAQRCDLIAVVQTQRRWRDELNSHELIYWAQVRNPAQTSRRSGV